MSLNLYTYVTNNPLIYTDPSGMCGWKSWGDAGDCFVKAGKGIKNGTVAAIKWISKSQTEKDADIAKAGLATYQFMYGDDVDTIMNPDSSDEAKKLAYGNLALSLIPVEGQLAAVGTKLGAKVLTKAEAKALAKLYLKDYSSKNTKNLSASFISEGHARAFAREKLGKDAVYIGDNKYRSKDGVWQYRAKSVDTTDNHVHLEKLDPNTGEVLDNWHLNYPEGTSR